MFGGRKSKEPQPMTNREFLEIVGYHAGALAWYQLKDYYKAKRKLGGPTLGDVASQLDLNVVATLLQELHKNETIGEERKIFAKALRRDAGRVENRGYKKEAERKRRLAGRIMLPVPED